MKHVYFSSLLLAIAFLFFTNYLIAQTCLPGVNTFTSQQQIDNFASNYPGCTEISGYLFINENTPGGITSLSGLSQITTINQGFSISSNSQLLSLTGLENLTSIGLYLRIYDSPALTSLTSLENLTSIGWYLEFRNNAALTSLTGLENLTSIDGYLEIWYNTALTSLTGLENLTSIDGDLYIANNDSLTNLTGLENITSVGGYLEIVNNTTLPSLTGLENLISIDDYLLIQNNPALTGLTGLDNLTSISDYLIIADNPALLGLTGLESLTSIGGDLRIGDIDILPSFTGLDNLNTIGGDLLISSNDSLLSLAGLENITSIGGDLHISTNGALTSLTGLENITSLNGGLWIRYNNALPNLTGLENITSLNGGLWIEGNDALISTNGLENMTSIGGAIRIDDNDALISLNGLKNIDYNTIDDLHIEGNSNLSICSFASTCGYLANGGTYDITSNATGCYNYIEILSACENLGRLKAIVYYDVNQNKIQDSLEPYYTDATIVIETTNEVFPLNPQTMFYIEPGNYTFSYDLSNTSWQLTTDSVSYFLSLEPNEVDTVYFGVYPTQQVSEQISYINAPNARCNEAITFDVSTKNLGTTITSGTLWLVADTNVTSLDFLNTPPDQTVPPNRYGWNFTDLYPSQTFEVQVDIGIPGPPDFPLGDLLNFDAYAPYMDSNGSHPPVLFEYHTEVQCSFDPNDKLVYPDRTNEFDENYTLFDENLFYTVRFQNTGNAVAYDVVIKDTLDTDLDWTTFQYLGSSHANVLTTTMDEDGILEFEFRDIFLPDSTSNFEGSQGYVSYLMKANEGLAENTIIENSAGIYFDLNPPVITNTTENVMVSELPTISTTTPDALPDISIFPNPNTGLFEIKGIAEGDYTILNTAGQLIRRGVLNGDLSIDISDEPQGIYFISIRIDEQTAMTRLVKL